MVLSISYKDLSSTVTEARRLSAGLGQYADDLSSKVQQRIYSTTGGMSGALNNADYFIGQKIAELRTRSRNAELLASKLQALHDTARRVDEGVASAINMNQQAFFRKNLHLQPPNRRRISIQVNLGRIGDLIGRLFIRGKVILPSAGDTLKEGIRNIWEKAFVGKAPMVAGKGSVAAAMAAITAPMGATAAYSLKVVNPTVYIAVATPALFPAGKAVAAALKKTKYASASLQAREPNVGTLTRRSSYG